MPRNRSEKEVGEELGLRPQDLERLKRMREAAWRWRAKTTSQPVTQAEKDAIAMMELVTEAREYAERARRSWAYTETEATPGRSLEEAMDIIKETLPFPWETINEQED